MIRSLPGFPENVVAAVATGHVTRQDYESVLIPQVEAVAKSHPKVRCYYELGSDFAGMAPGAMWEDVRVGIEYWARWERVAVVTDITWIAQAVKAFGFLMPGRIRVYALSDKQSARGWVEAP